MKTEYLIIGGGLSGLIMGMKLTKEKKEYIIIERSKNLIEAKLHYLHFDKYLAETAFPFPLREINIEENIYWKDKVLKQRATIEMKNMFSVSTIGKVTDNSMKYITGEDKKGYVPDAGIENISSLVLEANREKPLIGYNLVNINHIDKVAKVEYQDEKNKTQIIDIEYKYIVSTIPLPIMLKLAGIEFDVKFEFEPLEMIEMNIPYEYYEELFQILYIPNGEYGVTRFSLLGRRVVAELGHKDLPMRVLFKNALQAHLKIFFPQVEFKSVKFTGAVNPFGRFIPVPKHSRSILINKLRELGIICLGRYAAWDYKRTDHVVSDAEYIAKGLEDHV